MVVALSMYRQKARTRCFSRIDLKASTSSPTCFSRVIKNHLTFLSVPTLARPNKSQNCFCALETYSKAFT